MLPYHENRPGLRVGRHVVGNVIFRRGRHVERLRVIAEQRAPAAEQDDEPLRVFFHSPAFPNCIPERGEAGQETAREGVSFEEFAGVRENADMNYAQARALFDELDVNKDGALGSSIYGSIDRS